MWRAEEDSVKIPILFLVIGAKELPSGLRGGSMDADAGVCGGAEGGGRRAVNE